MLPLPPRGGASAAREVLSRGCRAGAQPVTQCTVVASFFYRIRFAFGSGMPFKLDWLLGDANIRSSSDLDDGPSRAPGAALVTKRRGGCV